MRFLSSRHSLKLKSCCISRLFFFLCSFPLSCVAIFAICFPSFIRNLLDSSSGFVGGLACSGLLWTYVFPPPKEHGCSAPLHVVVAPHWQVRKCGIAKLCDLYPIFLLVLYPVSARLGRKCASCETASPKLLWVGPRKFVCLFSFLKTFKAYGCCIGELVAFFSFFFCFSLW